MSVPTAIDPIAGVPVFRITSGKGAHFLPYYTADAVSADGEFVCCSYDGGTGVSQAWVYSLLSGEGRCVSSVKEGIQGEGVVFHRTRPWLCFASPRVLYLHDLATGRTEELFRAEDGFRIHPNISLGQGYAVIGVNEQIRPGRGRDGVPPLALRTMSQGQSFLFAIDLESGVVTAIWSDTGLLTHAVVSPASDNLVLYANQGNRERLQELFTIPLIERDNRAPLKLYHSLQQRPIYVGHSFFTQDGWVGTQLIEFGGQRADGSYADMIGCNAVIRPDGTCDRRARCPGGNKPMHVHAMRSDGWWVGDTFAEEGRTDIHLMCMMKNNWETGYCQSEPLLAHGCTMERPYHVHPRFIRSGTSVLFASNYTGDFHIYVADVGDFMANWKDRVPFEPRARRYCYPPDSERLNPRRGPAL